MKRVLASIVALACLFALAGCSTQTQPTTSTNAISGSAAKLAVGSAEELLEDSAEAAEAAALTDPASLNATEALEATETASAFNVESLVQALQPEKLTTKAISAGQIGSFLGKKKDPTATVLVYMNGSDLESGYGEASADITEMLGSGIGSNANVVIETLGTSKWQKYGIASNHAQRYAIEDADLKLVDNSLGQLDTTSSETLRDFITWGVGQYPADRYMLIMWDHGAGPVWGFGYDEFQGDYAALTLDEIQDALNEADVHFDFIGFDACLMSSLETACVLAPFCDYSILSEDFEPGIGWYYNDWMRSLEQNPAIDTAELGTQIVDDMVKANKAGLTESDATLALIDESIAPLLYSTWVDFAYANTDELLGVNYSQETMQRGRASEGSRAVSDYLNGLLSLLDDSYGYDDYDYDYGYGYGYGSGYGSDYGSGYGSGNYGYGYGSGYTGYGYDGYGYYDDSHGYYDGGFYGSSSGGSGGWGSLFDLWEYDTSNVTMADYYVTDIMAVASSIDSDEADALAAAVANAIVHYNCTSGEIGMTGLGVTLPYGDAEFYDELVRVFTACGFDEGYLDWLEKFVDASGSDNFFDYQQFGSDWLGWDSLIDLLDYDWSDWAWSNGNYWDDYQDYGWFDNWYDDNDSSGGGWLGFFASLF